MSLTHRLFTRLSIAIAERLTYPLHEWMGELRRNSRPSIHRDYTYYLITLQAPLAFEAAASWMFDNGQENQRNETRGTGLAGGYVEDSIGSDGHAPAVSQTRPADLRDRRIAGST